MNKKIKKEYNDSGIEVIEPEKDKSAGPVMIVAMLLIIFVIIAVFGNTLYYTYLGSDEDQKIKEKEKIIEDILKTNPNNLTYSQINCLSTQFKFYGSEFCPHCQDQKKMLGKDISDVTYVDCDNYRALCEDLNIQAYPTNILFNKETGEMSRVLGGIPLNDILNYTKCYE